MQRDLNSEYYAMMRRFKRNEKYLAPLMFPTMEDKRRARNGINLSDVSTPKTTDYTKSVTSRPKLLSQQSDVRSSKSKTSQSRKSGTKLIHLNSPKPILEQNHVKIPELPLNNLTNLKIESGLFSPQGHNKMRFDSVGVKAYPMTP